MLNTLYGKLALVLATLLGAIGLSYGLISHTLTQRYLQEAQQSFNRDLARNLVADQRLIAEGKLDPKALKATFERYMTINPSIEIYWLDTTGAILAYSAEPAVVKRDRVALEPIRAFLAGAELPILGDDPRSHDARKSFSVTPIPATEPPEGYLYVVLRGQMYESFERFYQDSLLLQLSAWVLAGSLLAGLLAGLLLFRLLTRRLRRLTAVVDAFQHSEFATYVPYHRQEGGGDEIEQLGTNFDRMAERLQALIGALRERDTLRRELVNHVSHDLRTPLATLHGYLETLQLKADRLSPTEQQLYLGAALRHSRRLGRLVGDLFELAKLDAHAIQPRRERFPAAELLQDIAQKYQIAAREQSIQIDLRLPPTALFIEADIGMIERLLDNVILNALHHTPSEGCITLELGTRENIAVFAVADTGHGIAPDDLPFVFDRFHRGSRQVTDDGNHLGLGLAIAKRIAELQGGELRVSSEVNQGTRFTFDLPVCAP
ncbi:MAG: HAMP domain-containing protein [Candidatus Competibacteraceae bacterium]|uniref:histidine kinase n=1 Tax=Candidatus Contendobacter odensis Run_B_J11 TaxID=1400861 RepID=A0A7U7J3G2_9GAMM|nr:ATP-binding protein [Candidatus Contendobacter odensis]MBK8533634.1 HAMP domain-containing protein [Candidatus Competibacteraceae bacterium]MBK8754012.1 HAMP domain-containing protein [Candidatus Competibacteraceae bacterium]CDH44564.1 Sensor histidine kinase ResE [Candidatus Contendobacter odensis Run_B_J11]